MRFYYTGSTIYLGQQLNPIKSLGGYISNSLVPNNSINNLFPPITPFTIKDNINFNIIGIVLKNETGINLTNIQFYIDDSSLLTSVCLYEFNFVAVSVDTKSNYLIESLPNSQSEPYQGTFLNINGIANKMTLPSLLNNAYLGIFIKRTINKQAILAPYDNTLLSNRFINQNQGNLYNGNAPIYGLNEYDATTTTTTTIIPSPSPLLPIISNTEQISLVISF